MRQLLLVLTLSALACGKLKESPTAPGNGGGEPVDPTATFSRVRAEVFTPTCTAIGCHGTFAPQENLVLTASQAYTQIVGVPSVELQGVPRVTAGDPNNSYVYRKITGSNITGDQMPQGGPFLNAAQIKLVRDWIRRGAPND